MPAVPALVGELAGPLPVVAPLISCADLDQIFRRRCDLSSVAVQDAGGRVGLVMRDPFTHLMSGPYGYGRALWEKLPVAAATDGEPLLLAAGMGVAHACERLRLRSRSVRYHDALVRMPDGALGRVSAARLFDALAQIMADQAARDTLTGVADRSHFLDQLSRACADGSGQAVLVAYVDLDKMKQVNDALGHDAGDRQLRSAAHRLAVAAGGSSVVARLGGDEFAVLIRLPPPGRSTWRSRWARRCGRRSPRPIPGCRRRRTAEPAWASPSAASTRTTTPSSPRRTRPCTARSKPVATRCASWSTWRGGCGPATRRRAAGWPAPSKSSSSACTTNPSSGYATVRSTASKRWSAGNTRNRAG